MRTSFWQDEEGMGTLEVLLIVVVLVGIAIMFRKKITQWVADIIKGLDHPSALGGINSELPTGREQ